MDRKRDGIGWSLTAQIFATLMLSGPLLWLFINISNKRYEQLKLNIIFAIISVIILIVTWVIFIKSNTFTPKEVVKGIGKTAVVIIVLVIALIGTIAIFVGISVVQEKIFMQENSIFYQFDSPYCYLVFLFEIEFIGVVLYILSKFKNVVEDNDDVELAKEFIKFSKNHWIIILLANIFLAYMSITSVTVASEDSIIKHRWYNLKGIEYKYYDIVKVDTGFRDNVFGMSGRRRGDFYYKVTFNDGKTIDFWQTNSDKYDFTYTEYKVFDDLIMIGNVEKIGSTINSKYSYLGQEYIDLLCKVIENR